MRDAVETDVVDADAVETAAVEADAVETDLIDAAPWQSVLNDLWRRCRDSLESVERLEPWTPPAGLGPIPVALIPQAESLMHAQRVAMAGIRARKNDVSARLKVMRQVPQLFHGDMPVYVDRVS